MDGCSRPPPLLLVHLAEDGVPAVLDGVVGAAREEARDGGPLVGVQAVERDDPLVLLEGEGSAGVDDGAQVLAPPEAA